MSRILATLALEAGIFVPSVMGQTDLVLRNYFPAKLEFVELKSVRFDRTLQDPAALAELPEAALIVEVGFNKYARRAYDIRPRGTLSIEVITLKDSRGAYSLLTLLRRSNAVDGPPGDYLAIDGSNLLFAQGKILVRVRSDVQSDLPARVARSVSNRIGRHEKAPFLVSHLPEAGYDPSSLRYYLGPKSIAQYSERVAGKELVIPEEVEIAQARYHLENQTGILSLVGFPTSQLANEYFSNFFSLIRPESELDRKIYFKRAGPLLGILEGSFDPGMAERILGPIQFTYSIQWIYDKRNHGPRTILGVPVGLLGTVVRSLALTALLGLISLFSGILFASFRIALRGYAPNNFLDRPERTEMIRLKIHEN